MTSSDDAWRALFMAAPTPGFLLERVEGNIVLAAMNAAARRASPLPDSMVGRPITPLYRDQPEAVAAAERTFATGETTSCELDARRADRATRHQRVRLTFAAVAPARVVLFWEDLTTPQALELELRQAEARSASIVSTMLDAVLVLDATHRTILDCNDAASGLSLRTKGELLGHGIEGLGAWLDAEENPLGEAPWDRALRAEAGVRAVKVGLRRVDGTMRWCLASAQPIRDAEGARVTSVACTLTDVTELEASVAALRESEAKYRALLDSTNEGVWSSDLEGKVLFANAEMARMLGTTIDDLERSTTFDFTAPEHHTALAERLARRATGKGETFDTILVRRDGQRVWVGAAAAPIYERGRVVAAVAMFRDLTQIRSAQEALRQSQQWLETALAAGRMGVFELDLATQIGSWSPGLDEIFGRPTAPGIQPFLERVHPADRERLGNTIAGVIASPGKSVEVEYRMVREDGELRWARTTGRLVVDGDRRALVGAIVDVSERRQLEEALSRSQRLESLGRLAGGVAHDFNNLLTVILASIALSEPEASHAVREELATMRHAAERARDLTRQLLAFARRQVVDLSVIELDSLVGDMEQMLRRLLGENIEIRTRFDRYAGKVRVDTTQVEQVVMNLVVNARDAMPSGGRVEIETTSERVDAAASERLGGLPVGPYVVLRVRDTGVGMDARTRDHAFEPFFTTKSTGTGLGLASSYGIARQLGGTITIESEVGKGSTFSVYLPRATGPVGGSEPPRASKLGAGERVLLVEDDRLVRNAGQRILERLGYRTLVAASGEQAIELVIQGHEAVDLLMTDMVMPGMSGPELVRRLREVMPNLPVLVVSGHAELELERIEGASYLQKPYTMESLGARIRALLGR